MFSLNLEALIFLSGCKIAATSKNGRACNRKEEDVISYHARLVVSSNGLCNQLFFFWNSGHNYEFLVRNWNFSFRFQKCSYLHLHQQKRHNLQRKSRQYCPRQIGLFSLKLYGGQVRRYSCSVCLQLMAIRLSFSFVSIKNKLLSSVVRQLPSQEQRLVHPREVSYVPL